MQFSDLVDDVSRRLSVSGPGASADARHVELRLRNGLLITLSLLEGDARCALSSLICFFPEREKALRLFELLLEAHAFGYATQDAVFGIDRATSKVFLFKTFELASLDAEQLVSALDRFAVVVQRSIEAVASGRIFEGLAAPDSAAPGPPGDEIVFR